MFPPLSGVFPRGSGGFSSFDSASAVSFYLCRAGCLGVLREFSVSFSLVTFYPVFLLAEVFFLFRDCRSMSSARIVCSSLSGFSAITGGSGSLSSVGGFGRSAFAFRFSSD